MKPTDDGANSGERTEQEGPAVERLVTVCASCLRAACWQGEFYCDDYRTAGTVDKTVAELRALALEHPDFWREGR